MNPPRFFHDALEEIADCLTVPGFLRVPLDVLRTEIEALFACAGLLQGNWPHVGNADAAFIPGLAVDNWQNDDEDDGILFTAADLLPTVSHIAIPGYAGTYPEGREGPRSATGYPGGDVWKKALLELDVPERAIVFYAEDRVSPDGKSWNTRTEVVDFMRLAKERQWKRIVVVTTPLHTLRVLLTLVKAMSDTNWKVLLRPVTPQCVSWTRVIFHSQGAEKLPRYEHIAREWSRIPMYQENGSICSFRELRTHLLWSVREW